MPLQSESVTALDFVTASAVSSPAAETAIVTSDTITGGIPPGGLAERPVTIRVTLNVTAGTGTTALVIKLRQGTGVGGTQVGATLTHTLAAGASASFVVQFRDQSGVANTIAGTTFTLTIAQTGNSVAGAVNTADLEVFQ